MYWHPPSKPFFPSLYFPILDSLAKSNAYCVGRLTLPVKAGPSLLAIYEILTRLACMDLLRWETEAVYMEPLQ